MSTIALFWPPYAIGQVIVFSSCSLFSLSSFFFPRLFSADGNWMSTILPHMVWPYCKFRMQFWNVLHAARWKYRTQKIVKNSPPWHHRTNLTGYIFATNAHIDNRKKTVKEQHLLNMFSQYGELRPTNGWDPFGSLGHPGKFQRSPRLGSVTARHSSSGRQLYSAGRPSRWTLAHILVYNIILCLLFNVFWFYTEQASSWSFVIAPTKLLQLTHSLVFGAPCSCAWLPLKATGISDHWPFSG